MSRKTKIICTIGPASSSEKVLVQMIKNGMDIARLNFSHGSLESQNELFKNIKKASAKAKKDVLIFQDLQGPKIRIGKLSTEGVMVKANEIFILSTSAKQYSDHPIKIIPISYKSLHKDVQKGDTILIEDGLIETKVIKVQNNDIYLKSISPALIKSNKGINVPTASISANPLTAKDIKDLKYGLKLGVDFVALSFVRRASDIINLRKLIKQNNSSAKIIAKIERHEAVKNISAIIKEADAIMVARGDLGVETPATNIPIIQKNVVKLAILEGKPVIIATEMLQSMVENSRATRAEVSDAANAIFDHADAIMLSNETASGKYPVQAVNTLYKVAINAEKFQEKNNWTTAKYFNFQEVDSNEICHTATFLAEEIKANKIIAITSSGYTARQLAKHRSFIEIITLTPNKNTQNELKLTWGLNHIFHTKIRKINAIVNLLKKEKLISKKDKIIIVRNASEARREIILKQI